jgi:NAD(P)-dependent dehydrogenase (short-subunit alcohol dehydrogenase family)
MELRGLGTLITGGSRGLGEALAHALAGRGAHVVLVARGEASLDSVVAAIRKRGGRADGIVADVADKDATHVIAARAAALAGPIELLVHNASALGPTPLRPLLDTACEDLAAVLDTNVIGPFRLTKAIAAPMALRGRGRVVAISSDAAVEAYPGWGAYSASKAAFDHLVRIFAAELGQNGVEFQSIDPGEMDTAMHRAAVPDADPRTLLRPEVVAQRLVRLLEGDVSAVRTGAVEAA